jgi:hypothetical protein
MLRAKGSFPDRQRPPVKGLGLRVLTLVVGEQSQIVEAQSYVWVIRAQGLFPRSLVPVGKGPRPSRLDLGCHKAPPGRETVGNVRVFRTQRSFLDRERSTEKRFGHSVLTLVAVKPRQIVEAHSYVWVVRTQGLFPNGQRPLVKRLGHRVLALVVVKARQIVEAQSSLGCSRPRAFSQIANARCQRGAAFAY